MVTHLGQSSAAHALSGHLISHTGFSHLTSQIAFFGSLQVEWQRGSSQSGSQIAGHWGSSHYQPHCGWHSACFFVLSLVIAKVVVNKTAKIIRCFI